MHFRSLYADDSEDEELDSGDDLKGMQMVASSDQEIISRCVDAVLVRSKAEDTEEYISTGPIRAGADSNADMEGSATRSTHEIY